MAPTFPTARSWPASSASSARSRASTSSARWNYGRVEDGAEATIVLPNLQKLDAVVESVQVETEDGEAVAVIRLTSDALVDPSLGALTRDGTPVTAQVHLRDDGILAGPTASALAFLTKVGLR